MPSDSREQRRAARLLEGLGLHPLDVDLHAVGKAAVVQRLVQALVRVLVADVLADDMNRELAVGMLDARDELFPVLGVALGVRKVEQLEDDPIDAFRRQRQRHFVNRLDVARRDHGLFVDVAEERDLLLHFARQRPVGAAEQDVGLNTNRAQVADAVLCRLGLHLARGADERHEGEMDVGGVVAAGILPELADGLEKRQALDVADGAADLDDDDVDVAGHGPDAVLDLVGDVRNDLHGPSEVVAAPLLLDHREVDLPGRPVVVAGRHHVREPLVVPEIEVGLGAVVGHEHLAVLEGAHCARDRR